MSWFNIQHRIVRLLKDESEIVLSFQPKTTQLSSSILRLLDDEKNLHKHEQNGMKKKSFELLFHFEINIFLFFLVLYRKDCKRCVVIYQKHQNVLQYKESECEPEQNKPASAAISSVIRSDYSRFHGNEQFLDPESTYKMIRRRWTEIIILRILKMCHEYVISPFFITFHSAFPT